MVENTDYSREKSDPIDDRFQESTDFTSDMQDAKETPDMYVDVKHDKKAKIIGNTLNTTQEIVDNLSESPKIIAPTQPAR